MPQPVPVTRANATVVGTAIADGFLDNEIWAWITPKEGKRLRLLKRHYAMTIRRLFIRWGTAWTTEDLVGGCLWIAPVDQGTTIRGEVVGVLSVIPWILGGIDRGQRVEELMKEHRPREPHWYLETLSIAPDHQRQGHGGAMLRPGLERCDHDRLPAYLETQREANIPYYRRFGFEFREEIKLADSPPLWTMMRPAKHG